jgi:hypothetical protein
MRPNRSSVLGLATAALLLATTAGVSSAADPKPVPAPAPDSPGEPVYGAHDPGHEVGERLAQLITPPGGAKPADHRLPALDAGIIGVTGDPLTGYTVYTGSDVQPMTVLKLVTSGLSATAQSLTNITPTTVSAAALQSAWLKVFDQSRLLLASAGGYSLEIDPRNPRSPGNRGHVEGDAGGCQEHRGHFARPGPCCL